MKMIPFFSDEITITPHSASASIANLIGKRITLAEFAQAVKAERMALYELENGDLYVAVKANPTYGYQPVFIEGPEVRINAPLAA